MEREEAERLVAQYGSAVYRLAYARTGPRCTAWPTPARGAGRTRRT